MNQSSSSNQHPDPDDSVHQLVTETSYDFSNQIDSDCKPKTEQLMLDSPENDDSVDQLETQTSFEFSNLRIDANCKPETEKFIHESPETDDFVDLSAAETSFDFNQKPKTEPKSPENDDSVDQNETKTDSNSQEMTSESSHMTSASPDNDDSVEQSAADINAGINHLQIEAKTNSISQEMTSASSGMTSALPENDDSVEKSAADINAGVNHLQIEANSKSEQMTSESEPMTSALPESEDEDENEEDEDDEDEEGEFTFMYVGDNESYDTELFESGQIRFPLFDQSLLSTGDNRLPITVPVDNVFIESPRRSNGESDGISTGTFCAISKESESGSPEINIKSNSTGFSKLWRFRDNMNRSNSDGRDAYVFFQSPTSSSSNGKVNGVSEIIKKVNGKVTEKDKDRATTSSSSNGKVNGVKVVDGNGKVTEKAVKEGKKKVKSAHEVYLKQKGGKPEDERRRSYLPYRPGLMGFFTNVNGGLSKNVHPF